MNFVAKYNIRSPEKDSEKNMVLCKKDDDITPFDGSYFPRLNFAFPAIFAPVALHPTAKKTPGLDTLLHTFLTGKERV